MVSVLISFSRITIITFVIVFTIFDFITLFKNKISDGVLQVCTTIQSVMLVLFLVNGSVVLYFVKQDITVLILLLLQFLLFILVNFSISKLANYPSKELINNVFMIEAFGFLFIERLSYSKSIRHFVYTVGSFIVSLLIVLILKRIYDIQKYMIVFASIGLILLALVALIGEVEYGAKLSISIAGLSVQPSEFVKLSFLFFISGCIVTYKDFRGLLFATFGTLFHVLFLVLSKDLGTALIFIVAYLLLTFIAYKNYIVLGIELLIASVGGLLAYNLFDHIRTRFIAWSDPLSVIDNKGYQISQSLFAIGTGGWFGSGFTAGVPTKIPVVTKDFIFAAICEEMGGIVAVCLIVIFLCTSFHFFMNAFACNDSYYMLVANGIAIIFSIQSILNIGGVIKFIPSTGVTLPFISYGGSSLVSMFIGFFIVACANDIKYLNRDIRKYGKE